MTTAELRRITIAELLTSALDECKVDYEGLEPREFVRGKLIASGVDNPTDAICDVAIGVMEDEVRRMREDLRSHLYDLLKRAGITAKETP